MRNQSDTAMWIGVSFAVSLAIYATGSLNALFAFAFPVIAIEMRK